MSQPLSLPPGATPAGPTIAALESAHVVRALGALASLHRLAAFRLLVTAGPGGLAAGTIAARLGVSASALSFHLSALAGAGLVTQVRRGRSIIYRADFAAMQGLVGYLTDNCCGGVPCTPTPQACSPAPQAYTSVPGAAL